MTHASIAERAFPARSNHRACTAAAAAEIAVSLITMVKDRRHRGLEDALHNVAGKTNISYWHLRDWWKGRVHKADGARVLQGTWNALVTAYRIECARHLREAQARMRYAESLVAD